MGVTPQDADAEIKGGIGHAEEGGLGGRRRRPPRERTEDQ